MQRGCCSMSEKPKKPHPDFPLFAHSSGKWGKRINGHIRYFGRWDNPDGALLEYEAYLRSQAEENGKSRNPPPAPPRMTVERALNLFLAAKERSRVSGEIEKRTYVEHQRTCSRFANFVGMDFPVASLTPEHFAKFKADRAKTLNLVSVGNEVTRVKSAFNWLHESGHISRPMNFGPEFRKPPRKAVRRLRRESGKKLYSASDIWAVLDESGVHLYAMILLGINCGYGPTDCAKLPLSAINLETGWADYPRPKTEMDRHCPLWPETVEALHRSLSRRQKPKPEAEKMFFVRRDGSPLTNETGQLSKYFTAVRVRVLEDGGFYWLRHTFETIAGGTKDQIAVNAIMGHVDDSMAAAYREEIDPERLLAVTRHVREWFLAGS
jgi:integrase